MRHDTRLVELALGRIFRLGSRPTQPGDLKEYERCRRIIADELAPVELDYRPTWARDRLKGTGND